MGRNGAHSELERATLKEVRIKVVLANVRRISRRIRGNEKSVWDSTITWPFIGLTTIVRNGQRLDEVQYG